MLRPLSRAASRAAPRVTHGLIGLVRGYRLLLSPWLGNACRFQPTCSAYAIEALQDHGSLAGSYLAAHRIARCHPWCQGGIDQVPVKPPFDFRWLSALADGASTKRQLPPSPDQPNRLNLP